MSSALEIKEIEFARELRRVLDESAAGLPASTADRLAAARRTALARRKAEPAAQRAAVPALAAVGAPATLASAPAPERPRRSPLARLVRAWPVVALLASLVAIAWWEDQQRNAELADIDAAMLSDDLPLNAYLDHGFNAYLSRTH